MKRQALENLAEVKALRGPLWLSALGELDWLCELELMGEKVDTSKGVYECL